ncbi:transcription factor sma-9-like [Ornithodoros turicata]|uniref:transcription factor sma-9-like n=1 Tax=Ornithodoros turicata TaxID=34597 RepID=UPI0031399800
MSSGHDGMLLATSGPETQQLFQPSLASAFPATDAGARDERRHKVRTTKHGNSRRASDRGEPIGEGMPLRTSKSGVYTLPCPPEMQRTSRDHPLSRSLGTATGFLDDYHRHRMRHEMQHTMDDMYTERRREQSQAQLLARPAGSRVSVPSDLGQEEPCGRFYKPNPVLSHEIMLLQERVRRQTREGQVHDEEQMRQQMHFQRLQQQPEIQHQQQLQQQQIQQQLMQQQQEMQKQRMRLQQAERQYAQHPATQRSERDQVDRTQAGDNKGAPQRKRIHRRRDRQNFKADQCAAAPVAAANEVARPRDPNQMQAGQERQPAAVPAHYSYPQVLQGYDTSGYPCYIIPEQDGHHLKGEHPVMCHNPPQEAWGPVNRAPPPSPDAAQHVAMMYQAGDVPPQVTKQYQASETFTEREPEGSDSLVLSQRTAHDRDSFMTAPEGSFTKALTTEEYGSSMIYMECPRMENEESGSRTSSTGSTQSTRGNMDITAASRAAAAEDIAVGNLHAMATERADAPGPILMMLPPISEARGTPLCRPPDSRNAAIAASRDSMGKRSKTSISSLTAPLLPSAARRSGLRMSERTCIIMNLILVSALVGTVGAFIIRHYY